MDPEIWGPSAWIFLHTITLNYPNNPTIYDKQNYKNFLLIYIIFCLVNGVQKIIYIIYKNIQ